MPVPATTGQLRSDIRNMDIGDYIICNYNRSTVKFALNDTTGGEMPLTGVGAGATFAYFYFIKVDKGFLMADRVISNAVSWDGLNSGKFIEGYQVQLIGDSSTTDGLFRSPSGGVLYADANGNKSNTDLRFGAFPTINEWDKYLINFPANKILSGKKLDDVFHYLDNYTWCKETPIYGTWKDSAGNTSTSASNTQRIGRGSNTRAQWGDINYALSSGSYATWGFRPVFGYMEV